MARRCAPVSGNGRTAGFNDACLFGSDFFDAVAKVVGVVDIDARDDGDERDDHVGGIPAAAHACFDDGDIDGLVGKILERDGGGNFEEGGRTLAALLGDLIGCFFQ